MFQYTLTAATPQETVTALRDEIKRWLDNMPRIARIQKQQARIDGEAVALERVIGLLDHVVVQGASQQPVPCSELYLDKCMQDTLGQLLLVTKGCRPDMHEPDEQGLKARVVGTKLDNAHGTTIRAEAVMNGFQEIVVVLERDGIPWPFNLCDLIALARMAGSGADDRFGRIHELMDKMAAAESDDEEARLRDQVRDLCLMEPVT